MASLHQIVADQISPGNRIISSFGASEGQAAADLLHPAPQQLAAQQKAVKQLETQQQTLLERTAWLS